MTAFKFDIENPNQQYIQISVTFKVSGNDTIVQLPSWRPGRYELGNFAKNVKSFKVFSKDNSLLSALKVTKDSWKVDTSGLDEIKVSYQYYASELNAGSTFLDPTQLYVNPVNCCVYTEETFNDSVTVTLGIPDMWDVATSMEQNGKVLKVDSFDELFDSPFIASGDLQHGSYESYGVKFNVWFNGEVKPDWDRLIKDFKAFTDKQIEKFTEFPVKEFHFLNQILPVKAYHGVEHLKSTVIALGPSYDVFDGQYVELLGVSSHELYHVWNVKSIRPIEMQPYNFTKENYSRLGYICEGITTYQGDLFLFKGGVFDEAQYFVELNRQLQRHFDNPARFNASVAESSFDTWLDGYEPGAPGRKVSIYTEGCLLAFVTDVKIRKATNDKYGIDEVMKRLYFNFAVENKGVSEQDYKSILESICGDSFDEFFDQYINGCQPFESIIVEALDYLGLDLNHVPSEVYSEGKLGFKTARSGNGYAVKALYPGGPGELGGLMLEDEIVAVNGMACDTELNKWLQYFEDDTKTIQIKRNGRMIELTLPEVHRNFFMKYSVTKKEDMNAHQKKAFAAWSK